MSRFIARYAVAMALLATIAPVFAQQPPTRERTSHQGRSVR